MHSDVLLQYARLCKAKKCPSSNTTGNLICFTHQSCHWCDYCLRRLASPTVNSIQVATVIKIKKKSLKFYARCRLFNFARK